MALLETRKLTKHFGGLKAVSGVDLSVDKAQILGLIGPNGAGKTTTFNMIAGTFPPTSGRVIYKGKDITGYKPHIIARMGIARTFQLASVFPDLSVMDNVQIALHHRAGVNLFQTLIEIPGSRTHRRNTKVFEKAMLLLEKAGLSQMAYQRAGSLPGGYQKLMSIILAMATEPELLLLDEPVRGLNAKEIDDLVALIKILIAERGAGIILVEHNMKVIMDQCDYIVVLNYGQKIAEGIPSQVAKNKDVIEAYLGV